MLPQKYLRNFVVAQNLWILELFFIPPYSIQFISKFRTNKKLCFQSFSDNHCDSTAQKIFGSTYGYVFRTLHLCNAVSVGLEDLRHAGVLGVVALQDGAGAEEHIHTEVSRYAAGVEEHTHAEAL